MRAIAPMRGWAALVAAIFLSSATAVAQSYPAIPESALRDPWIQQLDVLESLSGSIASPRAPQAQARLADMLTYLQVTLGEYETQVDSVIDRIVGDPQFAYIAVETSQALGIQLAQIHARFDALYAELGVREREDVRSAQASLDALRKVLQEKDHFERDVLFVLGSPSRERVVEFATRWWNGEERAIAVKKLVAGLRERLEGASRNY